LPAGAQSAKGDGMTNLSELLLLPGKRPAVVKDCVSLVDSEVAAKGGLSGIAIKGAYAVVKAVKPGIINEAVDRLLEDFVGRLEPFYTESPTGFAAHLEKNSTRVAEALLGVTDSRIERANNGTIKKAYEKLRPSAMKHVQSAVPGIGRVVQKHV
jgi:hypothetical protein